jgi:hypothetical protein
MMFFRVTTEDRQLGFAAHPAIRHFEAQDIGVKTHHLVDIDDIDPKMAKTHFR